MKKVLLLTLWISSAQAGFANNHPSIQKENNITVAYGDSTTVAIPAAQQLLQEILNVTGLKANFELKEADVLNIEASISHHKRYILYNPSYISWINGLSKDKWAATALLAHEVGHHLNGHTMKRGGSKPKLELEADEYAGFVLYKLGATLQESQKVMKYIAKATTSGTHPARDARMQAIEAGWNRAAASETGVTKTNSQ